MDGKRADSKQTQNKKRGSSRSSRRRTVHEHVSKGAIRRLARRGGVKRLSALIYDEMRTMLKTYLDRLVRDSIIYCQYFNRKTVQVQDVLRALKSRGERMYGFDDLPFPIKIRSTIALNDTPEESIPSTLELTETPETEINAENSEILKRKNATTSRRFLENDSDSTVSDITQYVKRNRSSRSLSEGGAITDASESGGSDISESLISQEENRASSKKIKRTSFNMPGVSTGAPAKPASPNVTTNETVESSNLVSTEENDLLLTENENRKTLNISKNTSKDAEGKDTNSKPSTSNANTATREPLNERRRGLFRHTRSSTAALRNSVMKNIDKSTSNMTNPNDSDDFQENFDLPVKNKESSKKNIEIIDIE